MQFCEPLKEMIRAVAYESHARWGRQLGRKAMQKVSERDDKPEPTWLSHHPRTNWHLCQSFATHKPANSMIQITSQNQKSHKVKEKVLKGLEVLLDWLPSQWAYEQNSHGGRNGGWM